MSTSLPKDSWSATDTNPRLNDVIITIGPTSASIPLIINAFLTSLFVKIKMAAMNSIKDETNRKQAIVKTVPFM